MKLVTFTKDNQSRVGVVVDDMVVDSAGDESIPSNMVEFLRGGISVIDKMSALIDRGDARVSMQNVKLEAPVPNPSKYLAVSLNYGDHINETGMAKPEFPTFFNKQTSCVVGPGVAIHRPNVSEKLDYEGELAVVIGKRCRHVPQDQAGKVIAGYMVANDVSVRDWQFRSPTFTLGKSFDTHGPTGPWIVSADEIQDPHDLKVQTWVNDDRRQCFNTADMIFNCYELIAYLSTVMTLEPGDLIATGTGAGVGVKMKPRGYMKPGDRVRIEIGGIGELSNPVIAEPENTANY